MWSFTRAYRSASDEGRRNQFGDLINCHGNRATQRCGGLRLMERYLERALTAFAFGLVCFTGSLSAAQYKNISTATLSFPAERGKMAVLRCSMPQRSWKLMLEPDYDRQGRPTVVSLSLVRREGGDNLLYQGRNLHGLQPFDFSARDLANGVNRSAYGQNRRLTLPDSSGVLSIAVDNAVIEGRAATPFVKALDVTVTVPAGYRKCDIKPL
jgi:hypothetical protein